MARYIGRSTDGLPKNPGAQIRSQRNIDQIEDKTAFSAHGRSKRKKIFNFRLYRSIIEHHTGKSALSFYLCLSWAKSSPSNNFRSTAHYDHPANGIGFIRQFVC